MSSITKKTAITATEYLQKELLNTNKHEYVEQQIYAMAGVSENHDAIATNILGEFYVHLKNSPCRPYTSDMKVKTSTGSFRYPDGMVVCEQDNENDYYKTKPVILVEVLSHSTRKIDEKDKLLEYINIPTLEEYVLIEQDFADVTVYRRSDDWRSTHYFLGEEIFFESIELAIAVSDIYHRVKNADMVAFLAKTK